MCYIVFTTQKEGGVEVSLHREEERRAQLTAAFIQLTPQEQSSALAILKTLQFVQSAQEGAGEGPEQERSQRCRKRTDR